MAEKLDKVVRFLNRAEELRAIAEDIKDPQIRADVLKWAEDCEQAARRAMESEALNPPPPAIQIKPGRNARLQQGAGF